MRSYWQILSLLLTCIDVVVEAFVHRTFDSSRQASLTMTAKDQMDEIGVFADNSVRRRFIFQGAACFGSCLLGPSVASAASAALQDTLDVDTFLRSGRDTGGNMGVSSQAGKSRPQTGVVLRDGSDVDQDKSGNVLAEILVGTKADPKAVLVSFASPLPLAKGPVFDVECRDTATGDGVFLAVTRSVGGKPINDLPSSFFLERLFDPTGRFSFYGPPTDIRVKRSETEGNSRYIEVSFSNLSQSTNAELPRKAVIMATVPEGTDNAVMIVASASAPRWQRGAEKVARETVNSFRATTAPKSNLKLRAKDRGYGTL